MENYYDQIAEGYPALHKEEQMRKLQLIKDNLTIYKSDLLLDVGCGPGFASHILDCRKVGLDPSAKLLEKCNFKTVNCEAEDMPFPNDYFDVVIAVTSIHNFDDFQKGIDEMKRVGKNRFAFTILKKSGKAGDIEEYISNNFSIKKRINDEHDIILICAK